MYQNGQFQNDFPDSCIIFVFKKLLDHLKLFLRQMVIVDIILGFRSQSFIIST